MARAIDYTYSWHEGYLECVYSDGRWGQTGSGGRLLVTRAADNTPMEEPEDRTGEEVVGWRAVCFETGDDADCWFGPTWTRVATKTEQNPAVLQIFSADDWLVGDHADTIMTAWLRHLVPHIGTPSVESAAAMATDAQFRLTLAVLDARDKGASWAKIGAAVGISRQSAHERWANYRD
ncbi:hypothetical protein AB0L82_35390 [Nocardia sp. NPDC052001]|uniref:hypothetical protein n=1 Tax=Nocardia sp. NPDC052001 TaxID=3154853 RepID=UPI00343654A7